MAARARRRDRRRARRDRGADGRRRAGPARRPARRARRQGAHARARRREQPPGQRAAEQLDRRRRAERRAGRSRCSASRTSSGCGSSSSSASGSTRTIPSPRGRRTSKRIGAARASARRPARRPPALHGARHRPDGRAAARVALAGLSSPMTAAGIPYVANMPTEEVFTTPDCAPHRGRTCARPARSRCTARSCKGLEVRFEDGRIVDVRRRTRAADVIRGQLATDDRAPYLGEVALVDGHLAHRQDGRHVLRHAVRRERDLPRRLRQRLRRGGRGRAVIDGRERLDRAHRLHDRRPGGRTSTRVLRDGTEVPLLRDDVWQLASDT